MRRKRLIAVIMLLILWCVGSSSAFAYPIVYCGEICFLVPQCRNECTGRITTCAEWWVNCAGGASYLKNQALPIPEVLNQWQEETSDASEQGGATQPVK